MFEKPIITIPQIFITAITAACIISIYSYIKSRITKDSKKKTLKEQILEFLSISTVLIVIGFGCRQNISVPDYDAITIHFTKMYTRILHQEELKNSSNIEQLERFMQSNESQRAKDSVKSKCKQYTLFYNALLDDIITHLDLMNRDSILMISSKTKAYYNNFARSKEEMDYLDSLISQVSQPFNDRNHKDWYLINGPKMWASTATLDSMINSVERQKIIKKQTFEGIFREKLER